MVILGTPTLQNGVWQVTVGNVSAQLSSLQEDLALHERRLVMRFEDTYVPLGATP